MQLETNAPEETQNKIASIAESKGGFVISSTQSGSDAQATRDTVKMTLRIPAAKFDEALGEIRQTASRVILETVSGKDVTEEFVDIEARLKAKHALEEQFLEIMKRSNSVADALNVQRELANVRGEIEQVEGRKRFLENQTSLSTIKVLIRTPTAFSGSSGGFFYRLKSAIGTGFDAASGFLFFLITAVIALIPFFLVIVLPLYFLLRYFGNRAKESDGNRAGRNRQRLRRKKMEKLFQILAVVFIGIAAFFLWRGNYDALFISGSSVRFAFF